MGILGISNRTENWKTAHSFAPFFESPDLRQKLAQCLDEPEATAGQEIKLELFWKGVRDYIHREEEGLARKVKADLKKDLTKKFAKSYTKEFSVLRRDVMTFVSKQGRTFAKLDVKNYGVTDDTQEQLFTNLRNTEIDIVIKTPACLYIGEAKHEIDFGYDGNLVLVHQLIRQYVTAKLLLDVSGATKKLVQFVVVNSEKLASTKKNYQVEFALERGWLKEGHILTWDQIADVTGSVNS